MSLSPFDVEALACHVAGIYQTHTKEVTESEIDSVLFDKLGVTFEQFSDVVEALIPYTAPTEGPITGTLFQGFKTDDGYIVKKVKDQ